jgi:hypothetical protein
MSGQTWPSCSSVYVVIVMLVVVQRAWIQPVWSALKQLRTAAVDAARQQEIVSDDDDQQVDLQT